jgi:hypothetical protein
VDTTEAGGSDDQDFVLRNQGGAQSPQGVYFGRLGSGREVAIDEDGEATARCDLMQRRLIDAVKVLRWRWQRSGYSVRRGASQVGPPFSSLLMPSECGSLAPLAFFLCNDAKGLAATPTM